MPAAGSDYQAFDADVAVDGDGNHTGYLKSIHDDTAAAIVKIKAQQAGIAETLKAKEAELKSISRALKSEG